MNRICKIFLIMAIILLVSGKIYAGTVAGADQQFRIDYVLKFKNNSKNIRNIKLEMPVVMTVAPHQKVLSIEVFPKPAGYRSSDRGKTAEFLLKDVKPGQEVKCGYKCLVSTKRVIFNVDAAKTGNSYPDSLKSFCRNEPAFPCDDKSLKNVVGQVVAGESNPYYKTLKIYDFIRKFRFQLTNQAAPVLEALSKRTVQCSDAAELLVTMNRAAGIPARYCGGFFLKESESVLKETHAWAEVYLPGEGWVVIDPTMGRFDDSTRLSRFCEIDSPYILMWRDVNNPFVVQSADSFGSLNISDFKTSISYKTLKERSGISVNEFYPVSGNITTVKKVNSNMSVSAGVKKLYSEADNFFNSGNMSGAEAKLRAAIKSGPAFLPSYRKLVQVYQRSNRLTALRSEFQKMPDNPVGRGARAYTLAVIDTMLGNYRNAEAEFNKASAQGAEPFIVDYNRGILYTDCKQIPKALNYLTSSVKANPAGAPAYRQLIEIMQYLEDDYSIAALCRDAVRHINNGEFYYEMSRAYMGLSKLQDAKSAAEKAVMLNPNDGRYNAVLGWVYVESGNKSKGREYINKAISLGVSGEQKAFLLNLLKKR